MALAKAERILRSAEDICSKEGVRFTPKRKEIFKVMLREKKALSAYEIADKVKDLADVSVPVMSIYRALEFLEKRGLVHKIISINRYSVCSHISCEHKHVMPRLAVCTKCQSVDEIASNHSIQKSLQKGLNEIDFQMESRQIELVGLCSKCTGKKSIRKA